MDLEILSLNITGTVLIAVMSTVDLPTVVTVMAGLSLIVVNVVKAMESWSRRKESIRRREMQEGSEETVD